MDAPFVGTELAAESSPDVIANGLNILIWNVHPLLAQRLSELAGEAGNILRGGIGEQFLPRPLRHVSMGFQATMGNGLDAVIALGNNHVRVAERFDRITHRLAPCRLGVVAGLLQ